MDKKKQFQSSGGHVIFDDPNATVQSIRAVPRAIPHRSPVFGLAGPGPAGLDHLVLSLRHEKLFIVLGILLFIGMASLSAFLYFLIFLILRAL